MLILIYLAVPVKLLCSRYGMCFFVSGSMYSLAKPKSIICIVLSFPVDFRPIKKFSGLTSRYIIFFECTNSILKSCKVKNKQISTEVENNINTGLCYCSQYILFLLFVTMCNFLRIVDDKTWREPINKLKTQQKPNSCSQHCLLTS